MKLDLAKRTNLDRKLTTSYQQAMKDENFNKLIQKLNIPDYVAVKYTMQLSDSVEQINNCQQCKGLYECFNPVPGYVYYPYFDNQYLDFIYQPCKFQRTLQKNLAAKKTTAKIMAEARMKDIDSSDGNRTTTIKWLKKFYDEYEKGKTLKGLYLHGNFGSGKTFLIRALFNELKAIKNVDSEVIYLPEFLRILKDDWGSLNAKINYYQTIELLLIDDIGAEKVTEWGRDEILEPILQNRMEDRMPTFFTSNLSITELEEHLALANNNQDNVKARRIIERIKHLADLNQMISTNRRN